MRRSEVIVEVGAEGGSLTLYGVRTDSGWIFSRHVIDQTPELLDEPGSNHVSKVVDSWPAALKLLAPYPWVDLYPIEVHPEFGSRVFEAVAARGDAQRHPVRRIDEWKRLCGMAGA